MLQAILEGTTTFGPMVALMLTPILIPLFVETVGFITDRRKLLTAGGGTTVVEPTPIRTSRTARSELAEAA